MTKKDLNEYTELALLLKYIITLKNIKDSKLNIHELNIELENLQIELNEIRSLLTTKIINGQKITLDKNYNIELNWSNDDNNQTRH